jgi:hypothetical protein
MIIKITSIPRIRNFSIGHANIMAKFIGNIWQFFLENMAKLLFFVEYGQNYYYTTPKCSPNGPR